MGASPSSKFQTWNISEVREPFFLEPVGPFVPRTKKYEFKELVKRKVVAHSEIPPAQQSKVLFEVTHQSPGQFLFEGKIKGLPGFSRKFEVEITRILTARQSNEQSYDSEKGLEFWVGGLLEFVSRDFFGLDIVPLFDQIYGPPSEPS